MDKKKDYNSVHITSNKSSHINNFSFKNSVFHSNDSNKYKSLEHIKGNTQNTLFPPLNLTNIKFKKFINNPDTSNVIKLNLRNFSVFNLNHNQSNKLQKNNFHFKNFNKDTYSSTDYTDVSNNDLNALISYYNTVREDIKSPESVDKRKKDEILRKFAIKQETNLSNMIDSHSDSGLNNKNEIKNRTIVIKNEYFQNQSTAINEVQLNKKIHDKILDIFSQKQLQTYLHDYEKLVEEQNKIHNMPEIKKIEIGKLPLKAHITQNLVKDNQLQSNHRNSLNFNIFHPRNRKTSLKISKEVIFSNSLYFQGVNIQMAKLKPKSRTYPSCCIYDGEMIVFGGLNSEGLDDIWSCDLEKGFSWRNVLPYGIIKPLGRYGHSVVNFQNELYFFGGINSNSLVPDEDLLIYSFSNKELTLGQNRWEFHRINHMNKLGHRRNHIAHLIGSNMIIYGGINLSEEILGDLWLLDLVSLEFRSIEDKGPKPPKLAYIASALVVDSEKVKQTNISIYKFPETLKKKYKNKYEGIYMFGGIDSNSNVRGELRILRIGVKPLEWVEAKTSGSSPQPRSNATLNYLENINILILFGGKDNKQGIIFNDLFVLDLDSFMWYRVGMYNDFPVSRYDHSAIIYENKLICFGGMSDNHFIGSDIYVVNIDFGENRDRMNIINNNHSKKIPFKSVKKS